ncbi:MAG: AAA family ATPase [Actinobacteria bacterium]|nr:AAA family ATPase [Actinomycetota bacterium]
MTFSQTLEPTLFGAAKAHRAVVLACGAGGVLLAVLAGILLVNDWVATSSVLVEDPQGSTVFETASTRDPRRYVADQVAIIESTAVARAAAEAVGGEIADLPIRDVLELRETTSNPESGLIELSVTADDPDVATELSTAFLEAYQEVKDSRNAAAFAMAISELDTSIAAVDAQLEELDAQIVALTPGSDVDARILEAVEDLMTLVTSTTALSPEALDRALQELQALQLIRTVQGQDPALATLLERRTQILNQRAQLVLRRDQVSVDAAIATNGVVLFSPAEEAQRSMGFGRLAAIGLLAGLGVGVGVAYSRSKRARRFEHRFEPEAIIGAPLLGEIPDFEAEDLESVLPIRDSPLSASAEAFRFAGAALTDSVDLTELAAGSAVAARIFAITSPLIGDGKTITAANVGAGLATKGRRVLLIDADFGDQALTGLLSEHKGWYPGLTDMVEVGISLTSAVRSIHMLDGLSVDLLSRGSQSISAPEFFRREAVVTLFSELRAAYDLILVDVPPMLQVAYSGSVVRLCDGVVVVVSHGGEVAALAEASDRIRLTGKPVQGYVYNKAPLREEMLIRRGSMRDPLGLGMQSELS